MALFHFLINPVSIHSEVELQSKLDDSSAIPYAGNFPKIWIAREVQMRRIVELRIVQRVESLHPELEVIRFPKVELLEDGEVHVVEEGPVAMLFPVYPKEANWFAGTARHSPDLPPSVGLDLQTRWH